VLSSPQGTLAITNPLHRDKRLDRSLDYSDDDDLPMDDGIELADLPAKRIDGTLLPSETNRFCQRPEMCANKRVMHSAACSSNLPCGIAILFSNKC